MARPHDISDLFLAPVVLAVEARLEELNNLDLEELTLEVALESDRPDWSRSLRESGLLTAVTRPIDTHGWAVEWDPRGLRLTHEKHTVVLGIPPLFLDYLDHAPRED